MISLHYSGVVHGSGSIIGGVVGRLSNSQIHISSSSADVDGGMYIGGLVGRMENSKINQSFATGFVNGTFDDIAGKEGGTIGGLVGYIDGSIILDSYATGNAIAFFDAGGLVGIVSNSLGESVINNSYSVGFVEGVMGEGGLVSDSFGDLNVSASFWNIQSSNQSSSAGGEGLTTSQMQIQSTFTNAGWDFTSVWEFVEGRNGGFPVLQWQELSPLQTTTSSPSRSGSSSRVEIIRQPQVSSGSQASVREGREVQFESLHTSVTPDLNPQSSTAREFRHTLRLNRMNQDFIDVTIRSEPIDVRLPLGVNVTVDLDRDGVDDVLLRFEGIQFGEAQIHIEQLQILQQEEEIEVVEEEELVEAEQEQFPTIQPPTTSQEELQESTTQDTTSSGQNEILQEETPVVDSMIEEEISTEQSTIPWLYMLILVIIAGTILWFFVIAKNRKDEEEK